MNDDAMPIREALGYTGVPTGHFRAAPQPSTPRPPPEVYRLPASILDHGIPPEYHGAELAEKTREALQGQRLGVYLHGAPGTGKCLGKGTPVLMADGQIKPVEEVRRGDRLMGPDGPKNVESVSVGRGPLYRIEPTSGEPWVCNDVHILTLVRSGTGQIIDIPLNEYLTRKNNERWKLFSVPVNVFDGPKGPLPVDPYFLGVWFGDGDKSTRDGDTLKGVGISKPDTEIRALCEATAEAWGLKVHKRIGGSGCPTYHLTNGRIGANNCLLDEIRRLVGSNYTIPTTYMTASRDDRLAFLAGFLDADAELSCGCFIITQKRGDWANGIAFIARSLGFRATESIRSAHDQNGAGGLYHTVTISGDVSVIPTRIPRRRAAPRQQIKCATRSGFKAIPIGEGDYYGFTLDGDGRFLLGDFTVTHNTHIAWALVRSARAKLLAAELAGVPVEHAAIYDHASKAYQWQLGQGLTAWIEAAQRRMLAGDRVRMIGECADIVRHRHDRDWLDEQAQWPGWLVVDDIGFQAKPSAWAEEAIYHLANERRAHFRPTLWTSNLDPDQLAKTYGAAIASRLTGGRVIDIGGRDRRQEEMA